MEENTKQLKPLVIVQGGTVGDTLIFALLDPDTGEVLCSHACSHEAYAMGDLYAHRPERIAAYKERYGEVEVKFLKDADITQEELLKRNVEWSKKSKACST